MRSERIGVYRVEWVKYAGRTRVTLLDDRYGSVIASTTENDLRSAVFLVCNGHVLFQKISWRNHIIEILVYSGGFAWELYDNQGRTFVRRSWLIEILEEACADAIADLVSNVIDRSRR